MRMRFSHRQGLGHSRRLQRHLASRPHEITRHPRGEKLFGADGLARVAMRAALVACALGTGFAFQPQDGLSRLLILRGGVQPAAAAVVDAPPPAASAAPALVKKNRPKSTPKKRVVPRNARAQYSGFQDASTAILSLSTLGAAHVASQPLMAAAPRGMADIVFVMFGSTISSLLFLILRLVNSARAVDVNRALTRLVLGSAPSNGPVSSVPSMGVFSLIGCLAACQTLPSFAG